ncbi:MAG: AMP-binding protein [Alphaproteobacteria bacterium]|nr:AMP-binding protein [Alphaproteobacteria bacterium]
MDELTAAAGATSHAIANSYVKGDFSGELLDKTIGAALRQTAARHSRADALVVPYQGIKWSWAELDERVDRLTAALLSLGLELGDRLAIWAPNCAEWVLTQLATARAGIILVTINPAFRSAELGHALKLAGCRALILASRYKDTDMVCILMDVAPELATGKRSGALPKLEFVIGIGEATKYPGFIAFTSLAEQAASTTELAQAEAITKPDDPINIQFTSGTTGAPKGATLTHRNILNNGANVSAAMGLTVADRLCIPVPLYHCFGMVLGVLDCIVHGTAMVFPGEIFDPISVLSTVQEERCTALFGVPTMFVAELNHPKFAQFDLSSLRTGIMAGAPCPIEIMKRVIGEMHMREITICYGMTETSPVSFQTSRDADIETRVSTVGTVHPFVEAKVVNMAGTIVPRGEKGELLVRGYSVMKGYWDDPGRTAEVIDVNGWMHSGDLATIDERGCARIVGRVKDMIIRGGENIYPVEVEDFLFQHPAIAEVSVFGIPDARYGEEVCAWIRLRAPLTTEELVDYCKSRIAPFKIPRHIRFVESFPMTVTGKIQKFAMRRAMNEELHRQETNTV